VGLDRRWRARPRRVARSARAVSFGAIATALLLPTSQASAGCVPEATPGNPPPGTTVTCSAATVNQNAPNGYGDGTQNGLTINVQPAATLSGTTASLNINANNTLNNAGTIGGANQTAIVAGTGLTVTNSGTINGVFFPGITAGTLNLTNTGQVSGNSAIQITSNTGGNTITNSGTISFVPGGLFPVIVFNGPNNLLTNNAGAFIIGSVANTLPTVSVTINNAGSMTSLAGTTSLSTIGASHATITNSGSISADGTNRVAVFMNDGTLTNSGTISAPQGTAIQFTGGATTTTNTGTITGVTGISTGQTTAGPTDITNGGTITGAGGTAIRFDFSQPNSLTLLPGSVINGNVLGGGGTDTLSLGGTGNGTFNVSDIGPAGQYRSFEVFTKTGTSTWTLTGTGAQNWIIQQGTLVGDTTSLQGSQITNNAALTFNQGVTGTYAGTISGSGSLTKAGTGQLILTGNNTYTGGTTISGGALMIGSGGTSGSIVGNVINNGQLTFNRSDNLTFEGQISGTGAVTKSGAGTLTLTGNSTYLGLTFASQGTLLVNGSLTSQVLVASGATVGGTGTVGGITTQSGAVIAPGNSIGQLNVANNVTFGAGSTYQVEANAAGQADRIATSGAATLNGGTVQVLAAAGVYAPTTTYNILHANAGVNGTFADVTSNLAFLTPSLSYDFDDVFLTLTRRAAFVDAARTPNQRAVATALDASPFGSALVQSVLLLTAPQAQQAFDALSGEVHSSVQSVLMDDSRYMRHAVLGRLRAASYAGEGGTLAMLGAGGPETTSLAPEAALAYAKSSVVKAPPAAVAVGPDIAFWGQGFGAWGHFDGDGNAAKLNRDLAGVISGIDARFGNVRLGVAGGFTHADVNVAARASAADIDSFHVGGYAGARFGAWGVRGGAAFAWHDIDTQRSILFPGFADSARDSRDGSTAQVFGEVGYGFTFGHIALEPFAGLAWVSVHTDGFAEAGGAAALNGFASSFDTGYTTLGLRAATSLPLANGMVLIPRVTAGWQHAFNDVTPAATLAFLSTGAAFTITGVPIARDAALVEAALDLAVTSRATVGVAYVGELADNVQDHAVKGRALWRF